MIAALNRLTQVSQQADLLIEEQKKKQAQKASRKSRVHFQGHSRVLQKSDREAAAAAAGRGKSGGDLDS